MASLQTHKSYNLVFSSHTLTSISSILSNMLSKVGPCSCFSASASATCCLSVTHRARAASSRRSSRRASLSTSALAPGCQHLQHNTAKNCTALFIFHCYFKLILITFLFCVNIYKLNLYSIYKSSLSWRSRNTRVKKSVSSHLISNLQPLSECVTSCSNHLPYKYETETVETVFSIYIHTQQLFTWSKLYTQS